MQSRVLNICLICLAVLVFAGCSSKGLSDFGSAGISGVADVGGAGGAGISSAVHSPEPTSLVLLGSGLLGMAIAKLRGKNKKK
ncbi:PEP-CTERM sorting domain-containing protein [Candidatus Omnitrophota bacterium]